MLTTKVDWNDTDLCASEELTDKVRARAGGRPCLFFTFNDYNGCGADMGIRNCLVKEYPKNIFYEDIKSE
ncbi:MAG: hypothetical protein LUD72_12210 [Bacteroidales bacterium]|nr:hypothetical protein [Bacteroidales bacterium]